jgi:hypothetical protein
MNIYEALQMHSKQIGGETVDDSATKSETESDKEATCQLVERAKERKINLNISGAAAACCDLPQSVGVITRQYVSCFFLW